MLLTSTHMGITAENIAVNGESAVENRTNLLWTASTKPERAQASGRFDDEIVPIEIPQRKGDPSLIFKTDEFVRKGLTAEQPGTVKTGL